ncbi:putative Amino acid/polyamine transporter I [Seiridium unicorne]|uniref:Amino acid/polyamine transporter I n=1 Tax=Seiridium unicorne TaxID=138068 RepID=A0ABR2VFN5_9PEZI
MTRISSFKKAAAWISSPVVPYIDNEQSGTVSQVEELRENFFFWSAGISFSLTNSFSDISTVVVTGINYGEPCQLIYDTILITVICAVIAASLAELASAIPNAGGQYCWIRQLAGLAMLSLLHIWPRGYPGLDLFLFALALC